MPGVGIDIVEIERIRIIKDLRRAGEYFLTQVELEEFDDRIDKIEFFASRFATKEAVIKAAPKFLSPQDFYISHLNKKPIVKFISPINAFPVSISLSHSTKFAASVAFSLGV